MSSFEFVTPTEEDKALITRSRELFTQIETFMNDVRAFQEGVPPFRDGRGFAIAMTHLETASFFLHKALARGRFPKNDYSGYNAIAPLGD